MSALEVRTARLSRVGGRQRNEDSCGFWTSSAGCCWVVSDGAGGHGGGDVASRLVVDTVLRKFSADPQVTGEMAVQLLESAQAAVMAAKHEQPDLPDMHATCVLLLVDCAAGSMVWGHVGDSRAYLIRGGQIAFQTRDHSLVQSMIDAGYGGNDLIRTHPQRSLLTSAIGSSGELVISVSGDPQPGLPGDIVLLCTDGLWEYVDEAQMLEVLGASGGGEVWLEMMASIVDNTAREGHDNFTGVAVSLREGDSETTIIFDTPGDDSLLEDEGETTVILPPETDPAQ